MGVLATDDFNRADASDLGANWTKKGDQGSDDPPLHIVSNQAASHLGYGATYCMIYTGVACPDDHYSQGVIVNCTNFHGIAARVTDYNNCYVFGIASTYFGGSSSTYRIWKVVAGTYTSLGTGTATRATSDVLKIEANGTAIKGYVNGVEDVSVTDSSITTGDFGIWVFATSAAARFDDWEGGDFAAAAGQPTMRRFGGTPGMTPGPQSFGRGW